MIFGYLFFNDSILVVSHAKKKEVQNIFCLDVLPTEDDKKSLLHCLFGQVNSNGKYECKDPKKFHKKMAKYVREQQGYDRETYLAVIMIVLRFKDDKRFPTAKTEGKVFLELIIGKHPELQKTAT